MISSAHLDAAVDLLNRRFGVVAVWLFGSEARGAVRPDSDVDLGALFVRRVDPLDLLDARAEVAALLAREVDLVDLAAASPILAMQVLRRGRLLVDKDRVRSRAFIVGAPGRYEDVRRTRAGAEPSCGGSPMAEPDVILAKVATIDRCLDRIAEVRSRQASLTAVDIEELVVLNLQRAAQAAIDLAAHLVAGEAWGLPDSVAGAFTLLERHGVVDARLAERLRRLAGFRNIAVHDYTTLDPAIVERIVERHLDDLRDFAAIVVDRYHPAP